MMPPLDTPTPESGEIALRFEMPGPPATGVAHHEAAEYALLGLLRSGPAHGYRLAEAFSRRGNLGHILHLKMSLMYSYLHKLEEQGWVAASLESATTARTRRVFTLTTSGKDALESWLRQPVGAMREMRIEFMLKLALAVEHNHAAAATLVAAQDAATRQWLARLAEQAAKLSAEERVGALGLVLSHRMRQSEATLHWLADVRATL